MQSQKVLLVLIFNVLKTVFGFIFFYFTILYYDPEVIGEVQAVISFVFLFSFIFDLGFSFAHLKIYPEEENKSDCISALLFLKSIFIIIAITFYFSILFGFNFDDLPRIIIIIFISEIILQSVNTVFSNILIADNKSIIEAFSWMILSVSRIIIIIFFQIYFPSNEIALASIYIITTFLRTVFLLIYVRSYKIGALKKRLIKKYFIFTIPLIVSMISFRVSESIGTLVAYYWISTEAVAYYYAGIQLTAFRSILPFIINLLFVPIFSKNIKEGKSEENKNIITLVSKFSCLIYILVILLSFLYSDEVILFFLGETYRESIFIFNFIVLANLLYINDRVVYMELYAAGKIKITILIDFLSQLLYIALVLIFVSPLMLNLGIKGLALAMLAQYLIFSPLMRIYLWKKYKYSYFLGIFHYFGIAFIIYFFNNLLFCEIDLLSNFILIPLFAGLNVLLYFSIIYLTNGFQKEDIVMFKQFMNIKQLTKIFIEDIGIKKKNGQNDEEN